MKLVHRWQYVAPELDKELYIGVSMNRVNTTIQATFWTLFLGGVDRLLSILQERFPELGVVREDCSEMSWIQSTLYFSEGPVRPSSPEQPLEVVLNRTPSFVINLKIKSDYVQKPIPESGLQGIVRLLYEPEADQAIVYTVPYGGRMAEISESATPFPHRAANLYMLASVVGWQQNGGLDSDRYISWSRWYYSYLTPYVSRSPREAYLNYRDLDLGVNNVEGDTSYEQASIWGKKYFKSNFDRLVRVKTIVDPHNFFKNEQNIPPLHSRWIKKEIEMHCSENAHGSDCRHGLFGSEV